jgi:putative glutamine amidotransferase
MRLVSALYNDFHPFYTIDRFTSFKTIENATELVSGDALIVWGGEDIHPSLYNKGRSRYSGAQEKVSRRDLAEWGMMQRAKELNIPIIGVCRGAQMLCALAGGTLLQHVNNHGGMHTVETFDGEKFKVNSMHHQMMFPSTTNHNVVAWCQQKRSDVYFDVNNTVEIEQEPEFIYFPDVKGFAIQWHPECMDETHPSAIYMNNFIGTHL